MSYPKITDDNFGQSITNKFLQYKIPKKKNLLKIFASQKNSNYNIHNNFFLK